MFLRLLEDYIKFIPNLGALVQLLNISTILLIAECDRFINILDNKL
jgi:hypothetical protein